MSVNNPYVDYQKNYGLTQSRAIDNISSIFKFRREGREAVSQFGPVAPLLNHANTRRILYKLWWAYYDNSIYKSIDDGGYRKLINERLGSAKVGNLTGLYNPIERGAEAYQYVFNGRFGDEILLDKKLAGGKGAVNAQILDPISQIWKWSNMDNEAELLCRYNPVLGSCGIRMTMVNSPIAANKRVFLTVEHPNLIRDVEIDSRGNLRQIVLEYDKYEGSMRDWEGDQREWHSYIEYMNDDVFWMIRDGDWYNFQTGKVVKTREEAEVSNLLGFVPYVLVQHKNVGSGFGAPFFYGNEEKIDHINALATHIAQQIHKHVTATWLVEGSGPKPDFVQLGDMNLLYIQRELGQSSAATFKAMVADLNLEQAASYIQQLQSELTNSIPELKATDGEFLSHQSGGTVANLRLPAEQRIIKARNQIETGLIKAQKQALSAGILWGMWDVGTGKGKIAAEKAYQDGLLDHRFEQRPALPLTVEDKLAIAKTEQAEAAAKNPNIAKPKGGNNVVAPVTRDGSASGTKPTGTSSNS